MLASVTHILPLTNIRRSRVLAVPGKVLVRAGQKVNATDVIAQADIPSGHTLLDIRRGLGVAKASEAERNIVRQAGDRLEQDDVIAEVKGLFSRIVRAPAAGEIVLISNGQVLLRTQNTTQVVKAGFNGTVVEVIPDKGAVVEVDGALIQGAWGNGQLDSGMLLVVASSPEDEWTSQKLDVSMRGAVVMGGYCASEDTLRAAGDLPLRGLILSSMASNLLPVAAQMAYPIVVVEGFGRIPMDAAAYKLLSTSDKRDVSVNAEYSASSGERPEIIIPLPAAGGSAPYTDYFQPGQTVRVQGLPYTGKMGTIIQLKQGFIALPNGLKAPAAEIQLEGEKVAIPLANLEVIE